MKVVSTFHQPSSVTSSLKCSLTADAEHLVIAKPNRIEVSAITAEGLKSECSLEIWGRVLSVKAVPAEDNSASNLLVLLDHPHPRLLLLEYKSNAGTPTLESPWSSDLSDRHARHSEYFTDIVTTAYGEVAVVSCYAGKLKVVALEKGRVRTEFDVSIPEFNVLSLAFVESSAETYTLAILHIDHMQRVQLLARDLDIDGLDLSLTPSVYLQRALLPVSSFPDTENPPILVPVSSFDLNPTQVTEDRERCLGGVLVLGGRRILFVEAASVEEQKAVKGKDKRQEQRRSSSARAQKIAQQKEKEREVKKVKPRATVKWPWSEVTSWCQADEEGRRFFVGDMFGSLGLLTITDTTELILLPIGEISAPTTLTYLSSQILYVGSHTGNAQLLRVHASPQSGFEHDTLHIPSSISTVSPTSLSADPRSSPVAEDEDVDMEDRRAGKSGKVVALKGTYVEVVEQFRNLAPIHDAVMADTDGSGQVQIVTCSGGANTGALNVVRTGADFQELGVLKEVPNVVKVFPIRNTYEDTTDTHVLLSTLHDSHLLRIDGPDSFTHIDAHSTALIGDQHTLALANIPRRITRPSPSGTGTTSAYADSGLVVQVTSRGVNLVEYDATLRTFNRIGEMWTPDLAPNGRGREIVAASLNASQFVVAISGGTVVYLNLGLDGGLTLVKSRDFPGKEISAVSCAPFDPSKKFALYVALAFWDTNDIHLVSIAHDKQLETICTSSSLPALPSSLVLHNFGTGANSKDDDFRPYAVAGLVDGSVAVMALQPKEKQFRDVKFFPLGAAPVSLNVTEVDGKRTVFATGSRAAVFYWDKVRVRQSAVMLKDVVTGTSLNTDKFCACQLLATSTSLHIGQIRGVDKLQIRSVSLGKDIPRRIAYHAGHNVFGVTCKGTPKYRVGETKLSSSAFALFDGVTLDQTHEFECESDEDITAVTSLHNSDISSSAAFCVGTMRSQVGEQEPSLGRLMLFGVQESERDLKVLASLSTDGCVFAIDTINGMIAATVNTAVDLYSVVTEDETTRLVRVARWNHNYFVTSLVTKNDRIIVGDGLSSVSMLNVKGKELETVARDYAPLWPQAIESVNEDGIIGSNIDCNLFSFTLNGANGRKRLERDGHFYYGDVITRFLPGGLGARDTHETNAAFTQEHVFFTSSGRIGVVLHVDDDVALDLTALQRNMAGAITGPGDVNHVKWRTPSNGRGVSDAEQSFGFLDGDFLERFLTYSDPDQLLKGKHRAERIRVEKEKVEEILEKLQGLH